jgi:hypothetical protein
MWKYLAAALLTLLFVSHAFADEIDGTFDKVNRHLYGSGSGSSNTNPPQESKQQEPQEKSNQPPQSSSGSDDGSDQAALASGEDAHYMQADDLFINENRDLQGQAWIWVNLSKMVTAPTASTKGEGEFMLVRDGKNLWTKYIWKSRILNKNEIKLGRQVIAFNDNRHNGVYDLPSDKSSARGGKWFLAKITDVSDIYKGYVTVSGNYKVGLKNLRTADRK